MGASLSSEVNNVSNDITNSSKTDIDTNASNLSSNDIKNLNKLTIAADDSNIGKITIDQSNSANIAAKMKSMQMSSVQMTDNLKSQLANSLEAVTKQENKGFNPIPHFGISSQVQNIHNNIQNIDEKDVHASLQSQLTTSTENDNEATLTFKDSSIGDVEINQDNIAKIATDAIVTQQVNAMSDTQMGTDISNQMKSQTIQKNAGVSFLAAGAACCCCLLLVAGAGAMASNGDPKQFQQMLMQAKMGKLPSANKKMITLSGGGIKNMIDILSHESIFHLFMIFMILYISYCVIKKIL